MSTLIYLGELEELKKQPVREISTSEVPLRSIN
jgi:hypothetical protein